MKMKKLFLAMMFVLAMVGVANAQTWVTANQATVAWDASTTLVDGSPVPSTDRVSYNTYLKNKKTDAVISVGNTPDTQQVVVFSVEGRYFAGVSSVRSILAADGVTVDEQFESSISWSDDPLVCKDGQAFGFRYFINPSNPKNLTH